MRRLILGAAALLLTVAASPNPPAPVFNLNNSTVTATGANTARTLSDIAIPAGVQDVRSFFQGTAANCATNVATAVDAAVAAGVRRLFIPASCTYIPTNNTIAAGLQIIGGDWNTTIISVANRSTDNLTLGSLASVANVGIISNWCDVNAQPQNTQKVCPVGFRNNVSDSSATVTNWVYAGISLHSGPTVTGPTGVVSHDIPQIAIGVTGDGTDGLYSQSGSDGTDGNGTSAIRVVTDGNGDNGILLLNGKDVASSAQHTGIWVQEFSNVNANFRSSIRIDRTGDGTDVTNSLRIDDVDAAGNAYTQPFMTLSMAHQTSGNVMSVFQGTAAFSGNFLNINGGNSGGTFSGNFANFQIANTSVYRVDSSGLVHTSKGVISGANAAGSLPSGAVSAVENTKFSVSGDQVVNAIFQLSATATGTTAVRLTTDGSGTATGSNCGTLGSNNQKATLKNITLTATDVTTPAKGYSYYLPVGQLARFTGVGSTTWQGGTAVEFDNGTTTGRATSITADTTNACPNISWTPPTGNTDTWHIVGSFSMDVVQ